MHVMYIGDCRVTVCWENVVGYLWMYIGDLGVLMICTVAVRDGGGMRGK